MTKDQIINFRTRIETELTHLEQRTTGIRRELLQSADVQPMALRDGLDHAKGEADLNARLELNERDLGLVARLRVALEKITLGSYGDCELCEEPIDIRRMNAQPTAILCIGCQGRAERLGVFEKSARELPSSTLFDWSFGSARYGMA